MTIALFIVLPFILTFALFGVYAERKVSAFIQNRVGPMVTGPYGLLQTLADIVKLLTKEDTRPAAADKPLFQLAPVVVFTSIFAGFAIIPFAPNFVGSAAAVGVFYMMAIISMDVIGILMAGWGSNNKYGLYGAMRSAAQMISYEVPLSLTILCPVMISQTLDLQEMSMQQGIFSAQLLNADPNYLFGLKFLNINVTEVGGFLTWNIFRSPFLFFAFVIFFVASLAEANRTPFDLPESESELIAGYIVEYSGMRFAFLMLSEYGMMLLASLLASILFLGSWNTPLPNIGSVRLADWTSGVVGEVSGYAWGAFWLISKAFTLVFFQMLARWTYPRLRIDQLMALCWKYLTPMALVLVLISAVWRLMMI
ncbi:complex I subunit 1/NuoH family protein [Sediminitomix flava]|uniref:NADH-quinone oxidoreductase subunit H n=1 Tax=Sediminitomix flava TaxID=379075 RepID=A0A315ZFY6_SEDFL|nr:complex I subunit 1 family protein [Sediminitomix flava]PWJ44431.1 NADH dehydrogenase subunit H [Sediminitomix flava]